MIHYRFPEQERKDRVARCLVLSKTGGQLRAVEIVLLADFPVNQQENTHAL